MQFPVPKGEVAVSYHHRTANLAGVLNPVRYPWCLQLILKIRSDLMANGILVPGYGQSIPLLTANSILHISSHGPNYSHSELTILSVLETDYTWHQNFSDTAQQARYLMQV